MKVRKQRVIGGPLEREELAPGAWRFRAADGTELIVSGAAPAAAEIAACAAVRAARLDWLADGALVTLITDAGPLPVHARAAIIHEPAAGLYETLPLVTLDARARRFWRRVFLLVRIPGGRRLLKLLARRARVPG